MQTHKIVTSITMPVALRARIDQLRERSEVGGVQISRHRILLAAIERGLSAIESEGADWKRAA